MPSLATGDPRVLHAGGTAPRHVIVLRALHLGDFMCAVPGLRALRGGLPGAKITLLGLAESRPLVKRFNHLLDDFLPLPGWPGLPEQSVDPRGVVDFLADVQRRRFDLAIQMHGSGIVTNTLISLLGARLTAGFYLPGQLCPDPDRFLAYPAHEPEVRRHLTLMEFLGLPLLGDDLEFPLDERDMRALEATRDSHGLEPGEYACLHPGARDEARRWPPERFAEVGDRLAGAGLRVVLTGSESEARLTRTVVQRMRSPAVDLAGRTGLGALAALLSRARLLVSNDTGVSHLAQGLAVPSVIVFTGSDPGRWAPLRTDIHRSVVAPDVPGNACLHLDAAEGHRCLRDGCTSSLRRPADVRRPDVPVGAVLKEVYALL